MGDLKEDIGYVRRLVEEGKRGPIAGGLFLASAGIVFGLACFIQWAAIRGYLPGAFLRGGRLWSIATAVYMVVWFSLFYLNGGFNRRCGQPVSAAEINFGKVWASMALAIVTAIIAIALAVYTTQNKTLLFLVPPMIFAFYGMSWCICAAQSKRRWMYLVSAICYVCTLLLALNSGKIEQLAVMGLALLLTLGLPGLYLMREKA